MPVYFKNNKFYIIKNEKNLNCNMQNEKNWIIINKNPMTLKDFYFFDTLARQFINNKYYGCIYN